MKTLEKTHGLSPAERQFLDEVKHVIEDFLPSATVVLYGSVARGTRGPESDYDVLVLTDRPLTIREEDAIRDALYELQLTSGTLVSLLFYAQAEWASPSVRVTPLYREISRDGILL